MIIKDNYIESQIQIKTTCLVDFIFTDILLIGSMRPIQR